MVQPKVNQLILPMKAFLHSALPILTFTSLTGSALAQLQIIRQGRDSHDVRDEGDRHGQTVASGDFNGDGFGDLAAGAPGEKASNGGTGPEALP